MDATQKCSIRSMEKGLSVKRSRNSWDPEELQRGYAEANQHIELGRAESAAHLARELLSKDPVAWRAALNAGGLLVDAGAALQSPSVIRSGVSALERAAPIIPPDQKSLYHYNLANGYLSLGQLERGWGPGTPPSLNKAIDQ